MIRNVALATGSLELDALHSIVDAFQDLLRHHIGHRNTVRIRVIRIQGTISLNGGREVEIKDDDEDDGYIPGRRDDEDFSFADSDMDFVNAGFSLKGENDDDDLVIVGTEDDMDDESYDSDEI